MPPSPILAVTSYGPRRYDAELAQIRLSQGQFLGFALLWWLIPMAVLYGFGAGIGWMIRGFRRAAGS